MAMPKRTSRPGLLWPLLLLLLAAAATVGCDRGRADEAAAAGPSPAQVAELPAAEASDLAASEGAGAGVTVEPPATKNEPADGDAEAEDSRGVDTGAQEREAAERERRLAQREAELAQRERALAAREATAARAARPAPAPQPVPAVTPAEPSATDEAAVDPLPPDDEWQAEEWRTANREQLTPPPDPSVPVTLPVGTELEVEILDRLSSHDNAPGDRFRARVARDVVVEELVAVPAGTEIQGSVVAAEAAPEIGGRSAMALRFERLVLPSGESVAITASLAEQGRSQTGKDAAAIGGGALAGAILGRAVGDKHKKRGAVIGAILGAAVGSAVAAKRPGDEVEIEPGTIVRLRLDEWARVTVTPGR